MTQTKQQLILTKRSSGVAFILMDGPGKVNLLTAEVTHELAELLADVRRDNQIKALVLLSGKPDTFVSGADLHLILSLSDKEKAHQLSSDGQAVISSLENLGKPTVVGINGACLGGGLEMALACDRRIATDHASTVLGLPEVRLGIIPGMGGTQRLPRLVGLKTALDMILSGEPVTAQTAKEIGLIDQLVGQDDLLECCHQVARDLAENRDSDARSAPAGSLDPDKRKSQLALAERSVRIKTKGQYPAPARVIEVIRHGLDEGMEAGFKLEAEVFSELAVTDIAKNLISLFFNTEFSRQTAMLMAAKAQAKPVTTVGVVGSGTMGLAIAQIAALSGHRVLFRQTSRDPNSRPYDKLIASIERSHNKGAEEDPEEAIKRIRLAESDADLSAADLVIEATFEDKQMKLDLFERLEKIVAPDCLIASNTSSLSITELSQGFKNSGRFLGMHFFLPVDRMPLVEIISHKATGRNAIAAAASLVSRFGKIPTMVNDGPGFLVNRLLCTYILEAARLVESGMPLNWIDDSAVEFGMAMGPLSVLDEVGLDVAFKVADALYAGFGERAKPPEVMYKTRALGLVGKKGGSGIYKWDENGKRLHFLPELSSEIGLTVSNLKAGPETRAGIVESLVLLMIDEAARCLEDKIVRKAREIDLAMVLGTGFPAFRGGPLKYADSIGIPRLRARLEELYEADASGRQVSQLIKRMESEGRRFYSNAGASQA